MKLINEETIEDLKDSFGLKFLPEEESQKILTEILSLISKRAGLRIVENLDEDEIDEFEKIPENNLEEIEKFLLIKNPNTENIFAEELIVIKNEILNFKEKDK